MFVFYPKALLINLFKWDIKVVSSQRHGSYDFSTMKKTNQSTQTFEGLTTIKIWARGQQKIYKEKKKIEKTFFI